MPLDIDPEWEYWEPDPEIAEVMGGECGVDLIDRVLGGLPQRGEGYTSFRLGWGDPDRFWCHTAPEFQHEPCPKRPRTKLFDEALFRRMWEGGAPVKQIMTVFDVVLPTVKVWRDRLGLLPRPAGNHHRGNIEINP